MSLQATAPWKELAELAAGLDEDELRVLVRIAQRLRLGAGVYGRLHIVADRAPTSRTACHREAPDALSQGGRLS